MKIKPKWTIKAQIRTFSLDISIYCDYEECELYSHSNVSYSPDTLPLKQLATVLGLTYYEVWRWDFVEKICPFSDLKPRRVAPLVTILAHDTKLQADVFIETILGRDRVFSLYATDVLNSDLTRVWQLQRVLKCPAEFWHRGSLVKRM